MKDYYRNSCIKLYHPLLFWVKTDNDYVISFIKNFATAHLLAHVPLQVNWGEAIECYPCKKNEFRRGIKSTFSCYTESIKWH